MNVQIAVSLLGGLVALVVGGELLVRGASRLAAAVGISPLVIGLTVVAFGTSAPELAVSVQAGLSGNANIAVANVVGSNIFNILFTVGLCAMLAPLVVAQQLVRLDVPIMIGTSILAFVLALDGRITLLDGVLLFAGIVAYTIFGIRESRKETAEVRAEYAQEYSAREEPVTRHALSLLLQLTFIGVGLLVLVLGSRWLVAGASELARALGVSDVIIGLTIIALGTSLPEVATAVVATVRNERDIAIGNVVGSNLFNLMAIMGLASIATPGGLVVAPSLLSIDFLVMIGVAIACLPIFFKGTIARWEGLLFFISYALYTVYLILSGMESPAQATFTGAMLGFGLPLITVIILMAGWQALLGARPSRQPAE